MAGPRLYGASKMLTTPPSIPAARVEQWFDAAGMETAMVRHRPATSAIARARIMGHPAEQTVEVVVLRDGEELFAALIAACDHVDVEKTRRTLVCSPDLRLATEAEVRAAFPGFEPDALPPLAPFVEVALDQRLLTYGHVICAAGDAEHSALVDPEDIVRVTGAAVADVVAS